MATTKKTAPKPACLKCGENATEAGTYCPSCVMWDRILNDRMIRDSRVVIDGHHYVRCDDEREFDKFEHEIIYTDGRLPAERTTGLAILDDGDGLIPEVWRDHPNAQDNATFRVKPKPGWLFPATEEAT